MKEQPLASFQVITDTHVTTDAQHDHNVNFDRALKDIAATAQNSIGVMHVGDITDHGLTAEYEEMVRIWNANRTGLPEIRFTHGNHDLFADEWNAQLGLHESRTGMKGPYHDHWISGYHFIFLGSEQALKNHFAYLTDEQLAWLDKKLSEDATAGKPVFVFLHQPLRDTVAGSLSSQEWFGVTQDEELKAILSRHPQAIMFNGHTHWELDAPHNMFEGKGRTATMFNCASVGYLWTDEDEYKAGSQGYYVEIYPDRVLVKGRDFRSGTWVASAQFQVDYPVSK